MSDYRPSEDYISRGEFIKRLSERYEYLPKEVFFPGMKAALEIARELPAADVREVRRGKWIKARGSWCTPGGDPVWECSECGKGRHVYGIEHGTYGADVADGQWVSCPNCGALMGEWT